jgi:hypothetical protein
MAVLKLLLLASTFGCYSPELRDCTVTCAATNECANGQICGGDHFCAAPAVAGTCSRPDAGVPEDAPSRADAAPDSDDDAIRLTVTIDGHGQVTLDGGDTCDTSGCVLLATRGLPTTLHAQGLGHDDFERWTTPICALQDSTCVLVSFVDAEVGVRFRKQDP